MANIQIKSNQESVNPNLGQRVAPHANVTVPYEAGQKVWGGIRKGLDWYNSVEEQRDALRAVQATNTANEMIGKLKIDYQENYQGSNAVDMAQKFEQDSRRIMQECYANSGIKYKKSETMYNRNVGNTISNGNVWAYKYETDQVNKAKMDNVTVAAGNYYENWRTGGMPLSQSISDLTDTVDFLFSNRPKEIREQMVEQFVEKWALNGVKDALESGDYGQAMAILGQTDKYLSTDTRMKLNGATFKAQVRDENYRLADEAFNLGLRGKDLDEWLSKKMPPVQNGVYSFKGGVSLNNVQPKAVAGLNIVTGELNNLGVDDILITSAADDYSGHVPGSAHPSGLGIDLASDKLAAMSTAQRNSFKNYIENKYGIKCLNEYDHPSSAATAGHFHLEFTDFDPSKAGMGRVRTEQVKNIVEAKYRDAEMERRRLERERHNQTSMSVAGAANMEEAFDVINNSDLPDSVKANWKEAAEKVFGINPNSPDAFTPSGLNAVKYFRNQQFHRDMQTLKAYQDRIASDNPMISEKEQEGFNKVTARLNDFLMYISPSYRTREYNVAYSADTSPQYKEKIIDEVEKLAGQNKDKTHAPQEVIERYIVEMCDNYGWDPETVLTSVEWERLGDKKIQTYKTPTREEARAIVERYREKKS